MVTLSSSRSPKGSKALALRVSRSAAPTALGSVLVLAGRRGGALDPLAAHAGVSHKCMVPVRGEALIGRVLRTLDATFPNVPLFVSIENFDAIATEPTVARLKREGRLAAAAAQANLVDSVRAAAKAKLYPMLVTTADNVLVTPDALRALAAEGGSGSADAILVIAREADIRAAHPGGKDRFYQFRDGGYSNCNLFWLRGEAALRATEAFRGGGQFLKKRGRILRAFGLANLLRFKLRLHTLERMLQYISARLRVAVRPLVLNDGRLAIDVDNERSRRMVEEILARDEGPLADGGVASLVEPSRDGSLPGSDGRHGTSPAA